MQLLASTKKAEVRSETKQIIGTNNFPIAEQGIGTYEWNKEYIHMNEVRATSIFDTFEVNIFHQLTK